MEQCLLLSSGSNLHSAWAWEGAGLSEVYIQEALTASHPLGTFNYHQKATCSRLFGFCFVSSWLQIWGGDFLLRRGAGVEWGDKNWRKPKVLGLKCLSQRSLCVVGGWIGSSLCWMCTAGITLCWPQGGADERAAQVTFSVQGFRII